MIQGSGPRVHPLPPPGCPAACAWHQLCHGMAVGCGIRLLWKSLSGVPVPPFTWDLHISSGPCPWSSSEFGCSYACAWTCIPLIQTRPVGLLSRLTWAPPHLKTIPRPALLLHRGQLDGTFVCVDTASSSPAATLRSWLTFPTGQPALVAPEQQDYFTQWSYQVRDLTQTKGSTFKKHNYIAGLNATVHCKNQRYKKKQLRKKLLRTGALAVIKYDDLHAISDWETCWPLGASGKITRLPHIPGPGWHQSRVWAEVDLDRPLWKLLCSCRWQLRCN